MAIAQATLGAKLLFLMTASLRRLYSTSASSPKVLTNDAFKDQFSSLRDSPKGRSRGKAQPRIKATTPARAQSPASANDRSRGPRNNAATVSKRRMVVPAQSQRFITQGGKLNTTPENWAFMQELGIEHDNSKAVPLHLGADHKRIQSNFTTRVFYSPEHILHHHDLQYLDPRDHPLGEKFRSKYRRKVQEEPLWMCMMDQNGDSGLIRSIGHRRLTAAFWSAMEELGYKRLPEPGSPYVKGTVFVQVQNAVAASNFPASRFGEATAKAVEREWKAHEERLKKSPNSARQDTRW